MLKISSFIIEYISILALKRVDTPKEERVITHLILDEFDNFISSKGNIKTILKEAGKYNLLLTIDFNRHTTLDENIISKEALIQLFRSHHWHVTEINVEASSQRYISSQIENVLSQNRMVNDWANVQVIIFVTEKGDGVDEIQNDLVTYHAKPVSITELNYMNIKEYEDA